jgi:hypothetical protein
LEQVIYASPGIAAPGRLTVSPLVTPRGQGVLVSLAF